MNTRLHRRLSHYGTPVSLKTNRGDRPWLLTPQQHHILGHVALYPDLGVRERGRRLGIPPGTISRDLAKWCKAGILNRTPKGWSLQAGVGIPGRTSVSTHLTKV